MLRVDGWRLHDVEELPVLIDQRFIVGIKVRRRNFEFIGPSDFGRNGIREIFVIGDTASLDQDGRPLPGVAQVAMQQGRFAAKSIFRQVTKKSQLPPFRYFDKGNLAVVGKNFAVLQSGRVMMSGFLAWLVWALIHIQFLAESSLRFSVFFQWVWTYLSAKRGDRLIIEQRKNS